MSFIKRQWLRWNLSRSSKGDPGAMDRLYRVPDPWGLDTPAEQVRFRETTRLIRDLIAPRFEWVLEIGCGEGLQTEHLAPLAGNLLGVDPSPQAVRRATEKRIANATFAVGELAQFEQQNTRHFNLVTACEVLYYLPDAAAAFRLLNRLGEVCVATYYQGAYQRLDAFFRLNALGMETIRCSGGEWRFVWWRSGGGDPHRRPKG